MKFLRPLVTGILAGAVTPAFAHTGQQHFSGFAAGFAHPFAGLDHILAMFSVGLFASLLGGRAMWAVPASFIVMMLGGGMLGVIGVDLPAVEAGIVASIIVLGCLIGSGRSYSSWVASLIVGSFAVFHGYAHGVEVPPGTDELAYSVSFALATLSLHIVGLTFGSCMLTNRSAARLSGAVVALAGLWVAVG